MDKSRVNEIRNLPLDLQDDNSIANSSIKA